MNNTYYRDQYKFYTIKPEIASRQDCYSACLSDNFGTGRFLNSAIFYTSNGYSWKQSIIGIEHFHLKIQ